MLPKTAEAICLCRSLLWNSSRMVPDDGSYNLFYPFMMEMQMLRLHSRPPELVCMVTRFLAFPMHTQF